MIILRTLQPLRTLRARAQQVAGGDYGRRIGAASHDEIGELVREFDAMAAAIQEREQRLIRSERLATVGRMASQITHEVRNPLASIGLYAELLGDEIADETGAEARRLLASIASEVDRLTEITENYLRFARFPQAKLEREDLGAVAAAVLEFSRAELAQAGIALEVEVASDLPEIAADESQLRQALLNLVRNAREAMASGGRLRVTVDAPVIASGAAPGVDIRQVRLRLSDSGPGIPEADRAKIFDPFFSTKEKGTGLGLALVQQIVAEHGGRIDVDSVIGTGHDTHPHIPGAGEGAGVVAARGARGCGGERRSDEEGAGAHGLASRIGPDGTAGRVRPAVRAPANAGRSPEHVRARAGQDRSDGCWPVARCGGVRRCFLRVSQCAVQPRQVLWISASSAPWKSSASSNAGRGGRGLAGRCQRAAQRRVQIGIGGVDEDRDGRDVGHAAGPLRAAEAQHQLLGQLRALRFQRQRGVHLGELVGLAVLVGVELDEQRVRLDARRIERDRAIANVARRRPGSCGGSPPAPGARARRTRRGRAGPAPARTPRSPARPRGWPAPARR